MKKNSFFKSLPFKLLVGVILGIVLGLVLNSTDGSGFTAGVLNVVVTLKYILGQLINFCVPLIIIGFIAPSITKLGNSASRMLGVAIIIAYASSVGAALFSTAAGYTLIPHLSIVTDVEGLKELPPVVFELAIPQIMPVMSALVFSVMIGLAATWNKSRMITGILDEFQAIVLSLVSKVIIPILPIFIALTFCGLAYEGSITKQFPVFLQVILIVLVGHFIWMALLLHPGRDLFQRKSHGCCTLLWTSLSDCCRNHVLRSNFSRCPSMCRQSETTSQGYGAVWNPAFCQYPPLRFCSHRSFFLYDNFQNSLRINSFCWNYDSVLSSSRYFCYRRSRCSRRNRYGIPGNHYRSSWI